jgi:hypothetical protein
MREMHRVLIAASVLMIMGAAFFLSPGSSRAQTDDVDVNVYVEGCNNNGICQAIIGEDLLSCPADCTFVPPTTATTSTSTSDRSNRTSGYRMRQAASQRILITHVQVIPSHDSAIITWKTSEPAVSTLAWGLTQDFEKGATGEYYITDTHSMRIPALMPSTRYHYYLLVTDRLGRYGSLTSEFRTYPAYAPMPSILVTEEPDSDAFTLTWNTPEDSEFVRVMRYEPYLDPDDPYTGEVVYEGTEEAYRGQKGEEGQYYSVFTREGGGYELVGSAKVATSSARVLNFDERSELEGVPVESTKAEEESDWPLATSLAALVERWLWWLLLMLLVILFLLRRKILRT